MESRRIRLLSEAYLNGWLDFKNRQPWSSSREEVILYLTEQRLCIDMLGIKIQKDAALSSGYLSTGNTMGVNIGQEYARAAENCYKSYGKYKFPSLFENVKMEDKSTTKELKQLSDDDLKEMMITHNKIVAEISKTKKP